MYGLPDLFSQTYRLDETLYMGEGNPTRQQKMLIFHTRKMPIAK